MRVWVTLFVEWLIAGIAEALGGKIVERVERWLSRPKRKAKKRSTSTKPPDE